MEIWKGFRSLPTVCRAFYNARIEQDGVPAIITGPSEQLYDSSVKGIQRNKPAVFKLTDDAATHFALP